LALCSAERAREILQAISLLCQSGQCNAAVVLCRAIFEIAITIGYIAQDPIVRSSLFGQYEIIRRKKYADALARHKQYKHLLDRREPNEVALTDKLYLQWRSNFSDRSWSTASFRDMASSIGLEAEYDVFYSYLCDAAHSNARPLTNYVKPKIEAVELTSGTSWHELGPALAGGILYALYALSVHEDVFKLGFQARIDELVGQLKADHGEGDERR